MNSSDQIQARSDEIARWEQKLKDARSEYQRAVDAPHKNGQIASELAAINVAHDKVMHAKFKVEWLQWEEEITDEERAHHELG